MKIKLIITMFIGARKGGKAGAFSSLAFQKHVLNLTFKDKLLILYNKS